MIYDIQFCPRSQAFFDILKVALFSRSVKYLTICVVCQVVFCSFLLNFILFSCLTETNISLRQKVRNLKSACSRTLLQKVSDCLQLKYYLKVYLMCSFSACAKVEDVEGNNSYCENNMHKQQHWVKPLPTKEIPLSELTVV